MPILIYNSPPAIPSFPCSVPFPTTILWGVLSPQPLRIGPSYGHMIGALEEFRILGANLPLEPQAPDGFARDRTSLGVMHMGFAPVNSEVSKSMWILALNWP